MFKLVMVVFFLLALLFMRFWFYYKDFPQYHNGQEVKFITRVSEEPEIIMGQQRFQVKDGYGTRISITTAYFPQLHFGDRVFINGIFTKKLFTDHVFYSLYFPKIQIIQSEDNILSKFAIWTRLKAQDLINRHLPPISASLVLGILLGGKYGMPSDFAEKLRVTGVLHIIAASGANVAFVAGALVYILSSFFKRQLVLIMTGFGIVFYMFLASFEPSIVRAGIMALLAFGAGLLGRQKFAMFSLTLTLYIMLFYSPSLWQDAGFQFSFLSTLGILLLKPIFAGISPRKPQANSSKIPTNGVSITLSGLGGTLSEDLSTTIAAQVATLPVMLSVFGKVGILSLLVNAVVLWTIPIIMTFGALGLIAGMFIEPVGVVFLYLCLPFLWFFEQTVSFFGSFGWVWQIENFPWQIGIGYYLFLIAVVLYLQKGKNKNYN